MGEKLQVHLNIDEMQHKAKAYWYTWMPQTGNLLYCMPKLGTQVHLHFPNADEGNAMLTECVRTNGKNAYDEMRNYKYRQFLTEHDKKAALSPGYILFAGDAEDNTNTMSLTDGMGISMQSGRDISIFASGKIEMTARGSVEIAAGEQLKLDKIGEKSGIELSGSEINKYAEKIYHHGISQNETMPDLEPLGNEFPTPLFNGNGSNIIRRRK